MDISNLSITGSEAPTAAKVAGTSGTNKPAANGNSLPEVGRGRPLSEKPQDESKPAQLDTEELHKLVGQANEASQNRLSNLKFTVAEGTDTNVIRVEDSETGELIRQIPSEQMLAIARALDEVKQGMVLEDKA